MGLEKETQDLPLPLRAALDESVQLGSQIRPAQWVTPPSRRKEVVGPNDPPAQGRRWPQHNLLTRKSWPDREEHQDKTQWENWWKETGNTGKLVLTQAGTEQSPVLAVGLMQRRLRIWGHPDIPNMIGIPTAHTICDAAVVWAREKKGWMTRTFIDTLLEFLMEYGAYLANPRPKEDLEDRTSSMSYQAYALCPYISPPTT